MTDTSLKSFGQRQLTALLAMLMALGALGIDLMLPVFDEIREHFGLAPDATDVAQIVTVYFFGMAAAQILYGPIADRYGRKPAAFLGLSIYAVGAVGSALAPTLPALLGARFVMGIGAAGGRVVAVAVVRDVYAGERMARAMSFIMAVFVSVPIFAPLLGAAIAAVAPWQWLFWACAIYAAVIAVWTIRLPETLREENRRPLRLRPVVDAAREVLSHRSAVGYTLAMTFLFGAFTSYLASSELIIGEIYGRPTLFPFIFGGVATTMGIGMLTNARVVASLGVARTIRGAIIGYTVLAFIFLGITLATGGKPPFWLAIGGISAILIMHSTMIPNINTAAMQSLGHIAGMAAAVVGTVSLAGGAALGSIIDRSLGDTITPFVVGFVVYGLIAAGWVAWAERWDSHVSGRAVPSVSSVHATLDGDAD